METLCLYGLSKRQALNSAILDGLAERNAKTRNYTFIPDKPLSADKDDVRGGLFPMPNGLSEVDNLRTFSEVAIRQVLSNQILGGVIDSERR